MIQIPVYEYSIFIIHDAGSMTVVYQPQKIWRSINKTTFHWISWRKQKFRFA